MKELILNEQQIDLIKWFMQEVIDNRGFTDGTNWSNTTKSVATQILTKIEE